MVVIPTQYDLCGCGFFLFDLFDWGFRVEDGLLNDSSKASQSPRPKAVLRWDLRGAAHNGGSFL
jgi:hypothetical protein